MPPPTLNAGPEQVGRTGPDTQSSGPDNTTGQDFIFSPRTNTRITADSDSTVSEGESGSLRTNLSKSRGRNKRFLQAKQIRQRKAERAKLMSTNGKTDANVKPILEAVKQTNVAAAAAAATTAAAAAPAAAVAAAAAGPTEKKKTLSKREQAANAKDCTHRGGRFKGSRKCCTIS